MRSTSQTPVLARLSAVLAGLALSLCVTFANAQSLPDVQRLMKQNQMPQALEKVDAYLSANPKDAQGRFLKGLILTELSRQPDAIAIFTKLTEDFPELPEPYNNLAVLYAQQKQYDKARTALEMAIRTHPSYAIAHENLGDVYAKLASQAYDKALKLDSSNTATQTKLSMIKDMISSGTKPAKEQPAVLAAPDRKPEETKIAAAAPVKPVPPPSVPPPAVKQEAPAVAPPAKVVEKAAEPKATAAPAPSVEKEKQAEDKPAKTNADNADNAEADVKKAALGWANAWSRKDVKTYLGYYANEFQTPKGRSRKVWEAERRQRIDKPGKLDVGIEDIKVTIHGDKATASFHQSYVSATFSSTTGKTLSFVKSGGKWLISQERVD